MNSSRSDYFSASVVVYGVVCALLMLCRICYQNVTIDTGPLIPGIGALTGLCSPILCFWAGVLLRVWYPHPRRWMEALFAVASVFMLGCYLDVQYQEPTFMSQFHPGMPLAMMGAGFLLLPGIESRKTHEQGWIYLFMLALSAFCYTAIAVVKDRMLLGRLMPEHLDMELLIKHLLLLAEPLLALLTACLAGQFAFSNISLKLGSVRWLKNLVLILSIFTFFIEFRTFKGSLSFLGHGFLIHVTFLIRMAVQPLCVYIIYVLGRRLTKVESGDK